MYTRIAVFGSSYVRNLSRHISGDMKVPAIVNFYGKGGMKAGQPDVGLFKEMLKFQPHYVFLTLGGNDIRHDSSPSDIFKDLEVLVKRLKDSGVIEVYYTEIMERGLFRDRQLTKRCFNSQRNKINKLMAHVCCVVKMNIRFPKHYVEDLVHLTEKGNSHYFYGLRKVMLSLKHVL